MNVLLLEEADFESALLARIEGRRREHVQRVLGKGVGDSVAVGRVGGRLGTAMIVADDATGMRLRCTLKQAPPAPSPVSLVLALPRPPVLRRVLAAAACMGIKRLALVQTARVDKSYWGSPSLQPASIAEHLRLGLEQGGDTIVPDVSVHRRFRPFVEDELDAWAGPGGARIVAHGPAIKPMPTRVETPVTLVVGPEGGLVPFELQSLHALRFEAASLGPRPLRVEHAVVALHARLEHASRPGGE